MSILFFLLLLLFLAILTILPSATNLVVQAVACFGYESKLVDCSTLIDTMCTSHESDVSGCDLPSGILLQEE